MERGRGAFAAATAVEPVGDDGAVGAAPEPVRFRGAVPAGWDIAGNANGGTLLAIAARAATRALGRPDPVTVTAHYLTPAGPGPVSIDVEIVRRGRRFATAGAALVDAGGRPLLRMLGTFGALTGPEDATGDLSLVDVPPPDLPPVEECVPMRGGPPGAADVDADSPGDSPADAPDDLPVGAGGARPPSFGDRVDLRLHPEDAAFMAGRPSGAARMRGWFRFPDGEPVDTLGLLQAADAFPPTVFNAALPVAWTPTVELTAHVRARPAPGWLRCRFGTHFVTGGFLEEDGEIWDATDRLVAQSRQLALVPRSVPG